MSYQVLARKYRPATFQELEGQEHVLQALVNALEQNRLHQAYLFTGTRGVGKTTIARILAKCLSCESGVTATPCGECASCTEIAEGRSVDLIEVDAASRTGVDDMRELLENVQYMPTVSRFKVYLIDEVHMLSRNSFNAMLKTLEEPPEHVKFLFATTDPKKLPITVLSRCVQFNLKNMSPEQVVNYLSDVLKKEDITFEEGALWQLGRAADGSMRDALSLTDQAISYGANAVTDASVKSMLGTLDQQDVYGLLEAVIASDADRVLSQVRTMAEFAPDFTALLDELLAVLHRVQIAQLAPDAINNSHGDKELLLAVADSISREDVQLLYQIGINGQRDLPYAPDDRSGFEMTLLRMIAFTPLEISEASPADSVGSDSDGSGSGGGSSSGGSSGSGKSPISQILSKLDENQSKSAEQKVKNAQGAANVGRATPIAAPVVNPEPKTKPEPETNAESERRTETDTKIEAEPGVEPEPRVEPAPEVEPEPEVVTIAKTDAKRTKEIAVDSPVAIEVVERVSETEVLDLGGMAWSEILPRLNLAGVTQTLAANCALAENTEHSLKLLLNEQHASLWNKTHEDRIARALGALTGHNVQVEIEIGLIEDETPAQLAERQRGERQARAEDLMKKDAVVQTLIENFNGKLDQDSITPIQSGDIS